MNFICFVANPEARYLVRLLTSVCLCSQAGMALYKIVPKNPYYFWSVMSLVMQVRAVSHTHTLTALECLCYCYEVTRGVIQAISAQDEKLAQIMFLPLAERMVEKMVKEEKIEAEAEVSVSDLQSSDASSSDISLEINCGSI